MPVRRNRFTIGHVMAFVLACAILLALVRFREGAFAIFIGFVLLGFLIERRLGGTGILGGISAGGILMVSAWAAFCVYFYLFSPPGSIVKYDSVVAAGPSLVLGGLLWGAIISTPLYVVVKRTKQCLGRRPLRDESCGPIVWRPLGRTGTAASVLS
jgi:hypothetical protein